jgi:hypothetical protein
MPFARRETTESAAKFATSGVVRDSLARQIGHVGLDFYSGHSVMHELTDGIAAYMRVHPLEATRGAERMAAGITKVRECPVSRS